MAGNDFSLYPTYRDLIQQTSHNYDIAIKYYEQKQQAFQRTMRMKKNDFFDKFQTSITDYAAKNYNKYVKQAALDVLNDVKNNKKTLKEASDKALGEAKKQGKIFQVSLESILKHMSLKGPNADFDYSFMGQDFENFMTAYCLSDQHKQFIRDTPGQIATALVAYNFGKEKQKSAVTTRKTYTRTDLLYGSKNLNLQRAQVELKTWIDIENLNSDPTISEMQMLSNLLEQERIDQNVFGFQLKAYTTLDGGKWMSSAPVYRNLQQLLKNWDNDLFNTWSSNYAINYPVWYLSKFLFNIINPANIGIIYLNDLLYMSDFLRHYRFYMEVNINSRNLNAFTLKASAERGGGYEVYPSLANTTIFMKNIGNSFTHFRTSIKQVASRNHKTKVKVAEIING